MWRALFTGTTPSQLVDLGTSAQLGAVAVGAGRVFVANNADGSIHSYALDGTGAKTLATGYGPSSNLAVDTAGDLFWLTAGKDCSIGTTCTDLMAVMAGSSSAIRLQSSTNGLGTGVATDGVRVYYTCDSALCSKTIADAVADAASPESTLLTKDWQVQGRVATDGTQVFVSTATGLIMRVMPDGSAHHFVASHQTVNSLTHDLENIYWSDGVGGGIYSAFNGIH